MFYSFLLLYQTAQKLASSLQLLLCSLHCLLLLLYLLHSLNITQKAFFFNPFSLRISSSYSLYLPFLIWNKSQIRGKKKHCRDKEGEIWKREKEKGTKVSILMYSIWISIGFCLVFFLFWCVCCVWKKLWG